MRIGIGRNLDSSGMRQVAQGQTISEVQLVKGVGVQQRAVPIQ
jgi:hypothetical protein